MYKQNINILAEIFRDWRIYLICFLSLFSSLDAFAQMKWTTDESRFSNSMTLTAIVVNDNTEMRSAQIELGAFCGSECRGSVLLRYEASLDKYMGFLMIYGEGSESITLKVYNHATDQEFSANNTPLTFSSDAIHGNPLNPYIVYLGTSLPEVSSVTVSPASQSVQKGMTQQFTATVVASGGLSTDVVWSVSGNVSTGTAITALGGLLTVSTAETATTLTVRATSIADNTVYGNLHCR